MKRNKNQIYQISPIKYMAQIDALMACVLSRAGDCRISLIRSKHLQIQGKPMQPVLQALPRSLKILAEPVGGKIKFLSEMNILCE